jgi:pyridoxine 5-phosphate synthase
MKTRLSVNVNKIATLRNSRGQNTPNLLKVVEDIESFGSDGITIHPRPDQRHIRFSDAVDLSKVVKSELNVEGNPINSFMELVLKINPAQVTLVPDGVNNITSNSGWDTIKHSDFLHKKIQVLKSSGIRTSIFVNPDPKMIKGAYEIGADRIELYTYHYAHYFNIDKDKAISEYYRSAKEANKLGIGINAGHDLNLSNISFFKEKISNLLEVSIGHALITESLYEGFENVISKYKEILQ